MSGLLAAGSSCRAHTTSRASDPQGHEWRDWHIGSDRILRWDGGETLPLPGEARPINADPWRLRVAFDDGTRRWLDRREGSPKWRPTEPLLSEDKMHERIVGSCAASCTLDAFWTEDRHIYIVDRESTGPGARLTSAPVPGTSPIVRFTRGPDVATCEDAERFMHSACSWVPMGSLLADALGGAGAERVLHLVAVRGIGLGEGRSVTAGETFEAPEQQGMALIRQGRAVVAETAA